MRALAAALGAAFLLANNASASAEAFCFSNPERTKEFIEGQGLTLLPEAVSSNGVTYWIVVNSAGGRVGIYVPTVDGGSCFTGDASPALSIGGDDV